MSMHNHIIFVRTSTPDDPRRRWMKVIDVEATSRPDALRKYIADRFMTVRPGNAPIDRTVTCTAIVHRGGEHGMILAEREDRIDFEHYDFDGTFISV